MSREDVVYARVEEELARRRMKHIRPNSWAELARLLETTDQRVHNWKKRGVPASMHADVAAALGWSVDMLLGMAATEPTAEYTVHAPPDSIDDTTLAQIALDLGDLPPVRRSKLIDLIHQEAEAAREAAAHLSRKRGRSEVAAAQPTRAARASLRIRLGDGNPRQESLPLSTVADPFTAEPMERELNWYRHLERRRGDHSK